MGTKHQNIIEINGNKYDAVSGKLLNSSPKSSSTPKNKIVDGFSKPSSKKSYVSQRKTPVSSAKKPVQKSKTLMRSAVKKPTASTKHSKTTQVASIRKPSLNTPKQRQQNAKKTKQSELVSHYGENLARSSVSKQVKPLSVKQQSTSAHGTHHKAKQKNSSQAKNLAHKGGISAASVMIDKALADANSHENKTHKKEKKHHRVAKKLGISAKAMAISSAVLAGVLLGGFYAIQNVPNLSMRVAATRAGFNASMPGYSPSGFSFSGPINYSPGQVTVTFKSNTDDRNFSLKQTASNWNSDALLSNFVATDNQKYQTYQDRGRTLYIYDGSNATWVDNGIWYQIEGSSQLTTDQLVRIAASL